MAGSESTNLRVEGCDDAKHCAQVSHSLSRYMTDKELATDACSPVPKDCLVVQVDRGWKCINKHSCTHLWSASLHISETCFVAFTQKQNMKSLTIPSEVLHWQDTYNTYNIPHSTEGVSALSPSIN